MFSDAGRRKALRKSVTILWLIAALASLAGAGRMNPALVQLRRDCQLDQGDPLENAPPLVAFTTVALGGFRGIAVDLLWMRAGELQDKGRYFEMVQLADWITKLQPRFASIWAYHAWNLAYNISVMFSQPEDRWRWVSHGIELLRDEGLRYNPGSAVLYHELAWMFFQKIGGDLDRAHFYYKHAWAAEMTRALGGPHPDFAALSAAPDSPATRTLREVYKLDPARMLAVDRAYGPLDWRLPQAHAIYWAVQGRPWARSPFDKISLERVIFQSLSDAFVKGRLTTGPDGSLFALSPNLDALPHVRAAYEQALLEFPNDDTVKTSYQNFLIDAAMVSYSYNREREARGIYDELRTRFPSERIPPTFEEFVFRTYSSYAQEMNAGQAMAAVESAIYQSLFWRALGDADQAAGFEQMARLCWDRYMATRKEGEFRERTGLPELERIRDQAAARVKADLQAAHQRKNAILEPTRPLPSR